MYSSLNCSCNNNEHDEWDSVLFLSSRVQNVFRRLGHNHANSGHVLFSLSIIY